MPLAGTKRRRTTRRVTRRYIPKRPRYGGLVPSYRGFAPRAFSGGEWKYFDGTTAAINMSTTGSIFCINGLAPGTAANQRIGMRVTLRSLEFRYRIVATGTALASINRVIVLFDKQANGALPAPTDILNPYATWGMRNLENRKRFKIIWDKTRFSAPVGGDPSRVMVHAYIKFRRGVIVEFNNGVSGSIADIVSNSLIMLTFGDNAATPPQIDRLQTRIRYTDQ